jgi:hypothetical protein
MPPNAKALFLGVYGSTEHQRMPPVEQMVPEEDSQGASRDLIYHGYFSVSQANTNRATNSQFRCNRTRACLLTTPSTVANFIFLWHETKRQKDGRLGRQVGSNSLA